MKQPRATKEDIAEIRAGKWDAYGEMSWLIRRLHYSLMDARAETATAKASSRRYFTEANK